MDASKPLTTYSALIGLGIAPYLINGYINSKIVSWPPAYWAFELLIWVLIPAVILVTAVRHAGLKLTDLGFSRTIFGKRSVALILVVAFLFCPIDYMVYANAIGYTRNVLPHEGIFQYHSVVPHSCAMRTLIALYFALTAGFVEEVYFRGFLFKALSFAPAQIPLFLLLSPLLFAAIHWESGMANTAAAYISGLFSAVAFILMRNIWPLIAGHIYTDYAWFG